MELANDYQPKFKFAGELTETKVDIDPIPAKFRRFVAGEWQLTEDQQTRALEKVREQVFKSKIDLLNHVMTEILARRIGIETGDVFDDSTNHAMHALDQMGRHGLGFRFARRACGLQSKQVT